MTLEATFKASLDEYYRQYNPPQRNLQFVEYEDPAAYDIVIYGTFSLRPYYAGGVLITLTIADIRTGETQTFATTGTVEDVPRYIAGGLFHEYQKTRFPTDVPMFGRNLHVLEKGVIHRPSSSPMWDLYKQARLACEMQEARLTTETELVALGTLGDYRGGVSLGQRSVPTYYWAITNSYVYQAHVSQSTIATNLNPQEDLNYVCVQDTPGYPPRPR
ncbi:hypothetical protein D3C72_1444270 [compost metagenome]